MRLTQKSEVFVLVLCLSNLRFALPMWYIKMLQKHFQYLHKMEKKF